MFHNVHHFFQPVNQSLIGHGGTYPQDILNRSWELCSSHQVLTQKWRTLHQIFNFKGRGKKVVQYFSFIYVYLQPLLLTENIELWKCVPYEFSVLTCECGVPVMSPLPWRRRSANVSSASLPPRAPHTWWSHLCRYLCPQEVCPRYQSQVPSSRLLAGRLGVRGQRWRVYGRSHQKMRSHHPFHVWFWKGQEI